MEGDMNVNQLIDKLRSLVDTGHVDGDSEVRFAYQPSWPLHTSIASEPVTTLIGDFDQEEIDGLRDELRDTEHPLGADDRQSYGERLVELEGKKDEAEKVVYLLEGGSCEGSPYAPSDVVNEAGWGRG